MDIFDVQMGLTRDEYHNYRGPQKHTDKDLSLIGFRHKRSFIEEFPPLTMFVLSSNVRKDLRGRSPDYYPMTEWATPTPLESSSRVKLAIKDHGAAKLLGSFDINITFTENAPSYLSLLLETDGRFSHLSPRMVLLHLLLL